MNVKSVAILLAFMTCMLITYAQTTIPGDPSPGEKEDLDVFHHWIKWNNPGSMLLRYLNGQASALYDLRNSKIKQIKTKEQWVARQQEVKEKLTALIGPFPPKTPLNARVTGVIKKKGYRIERIVYESFPNFYVTGCIYIPDHIRGKVPAILNVMGHDQEAYKVELYQIIITNLVAKGMIVMAIDPPGQGEHVQFYDSSKKFSAVGYSVIEHCFFGNQCLIAGMSSARYFVWDGIRGIDYLLSRKEVDPNNIGVTGFSGGGTVTSYLSAIDERVKVSVPCSWSTASKRQLETQGVQDAETIFIGGAAEGITFEDLLEVRAPKPTMMTFVSRDQYLPLNGAREAYSEAMNAYAVFGNENNLRLMEDDSKHWMTAKIRLAIYAFFQKHFNLKGDSVELQTDRLSATELKMLNVTPTGQISTSLGGDMIFDVNRKEAKKLTDRLDSSRKNIDTHLTEVPERAKKISGYIAPADAPEQAFINGRYQRDGYTITKLAIPAENEYAVPFLLFIPEKNDGRKPAIVYVHPEGKSHEAGVGGEIERLVNKGYVVAAVDVLGIGEVKNNAGRALTGGYTAAVIGRSVPAVQAADMVRVLKYLKSRNDVNSGKIALMAKGEMCIPALHAAAFYTPVGNVILQDAMVSFRNFVNTRLYKIGVIEFNDGDVHHPGEVQFSWGIANVLKGYDLPDLAALVAPRKLAFVDLKDAALENLAEELEKQELEFPRAVYSKQNSAGNMISVKNKSVEEVVDWVFRKE